MSALRYSRHSYPCRCATSATYLPATHRPCPGCCLCSAPHAPRCPVRVPRLAHLQLRRTVPLAHPSESRTRICCLPFFVVGSPSRFCLAAGYISSVHSTITRRPEFVEWNGQRSHTRGGELLSRCNLHRELMIASGNDDALPSGKTTKAQLQTTRPSGPDTRFPLHDHGRRVASCRMSFLHAWLGVFFSFA